MDESLLKKLLVKPSRTFMVINAPAGYLERISPLPKGATLLAEGATGNADVVQVFVHNRTDVDRFAHRALSAVKAGCVLWLTYPKRSKAVQTDINRDTGWDSVTAAGWLPVTQIAIDETWSALRFRPATDIRTLTRKMA